MEDCRKCYKFSGNAGEDFQLWETRTEAALAAKEALFVVLSDVIGEAGDAGLSDEQPKIVGQAWAVLIQGLGDKPLRMCMQFKTNPFQMWQKLHERYVVTNVVTKVQLQTRLSKHVYRGQVMSDYVDMFEEIFNRLSGMGSHIQEDMQIAMYLASSGDKGKSPYGHVISSMQTLTSQLS